METIGKLGVWYPTQRFAPDDLARFVRRLEKLGYSALWYPESTGYESMSQAAFMLCHSERLLIGSSIANIYARDAVTARQGRATLSAISGGRFVLGLGVSHVPNVEGVRGHVYGRPVATMRTYLERVRGDGPPLWQPDRTTVIAALGPRMLELARDMTRGAIPYNVTPAHTAEARRILGPDRWLCVEQKFSLEADPGRARAHARKELERYLGLDNYRNNWFRLGFEPADLENGGSDRFIDAMVAHGGEAAVHAVVDAHFAAGADHVAIQPVHADGDTAALDRMLAAMAPGA